MGAIGRGDPIAAHIFVLLALGDDRSAQAKGQGQIAHHFGGDATAHQAAIGLIAPAIVQGRAPEPLVGIVLDQQAKESLDRIVGDDLGARPLGLHPADGGRGVGQPATIGQLNSGHLGHACGLGDLAHGANVQIDIVERDLAVAQIGL